LAYPKIHVIVFMSFIEMPLPADGPEMNRPGAGFILPGADIM
jgi:hypothetical protein